MADTVFLPTKVRLRKCTIAGVDMRLHVQNIKVYESMCKPYITSNITVIDNNNIINQLNLAGGEPVNFAFDAGDNVYRQKQHILSVTGQPTEKNKRVQVYEIATVGPSYVKDRASLVQESYKNTPATSVAEKIHNTYLSGDAGLINKLPSLGMIAKDDIGSYITTNVKPFKGIEDALRRATYGQYKSGSTVYFRDANNYVIAPLELLFRTAQPQYDFIEKATWGTSIDDIFNAHNAVIAASTVVKDGIKPGGSSIAKSAAASNQSLRIWDNKLKKFVQNQGAKATGVLSSIKNVGSLVGKAGGVMNILEMDSARNPLSSDPSINRVQEQSFQATVADATKYYIKVPIRGGLACTVGQGVNVQLMPPVGDQNVSRHRHGGRMLIADLVHDCYFDKRTVMGTTTFRGVNVNSV